MDVLREVGIFAAGIGVGIVYTLSMLIVKIIKEGRIDHDPSYWEVEDVRQRSSKASDQEGSENGSVSSPS